MEAEYVVLEIAVKEVIQLNMMFNELTQEIGLNI